MIAVLLTALLLAQDSTRASSSFELADAYQAAIARSPRVVAARALGDAAKARVASARRPADPQVQLGFMNYTLPALRAMDVVGMTQLQAMQMLPIAGQLGIAGRVADASADAAVAKASDTQWEVRLKVATVFYDLYVADRSLSIDRETLRLLHDALHSAEAMYRVGDGRQTDVLRAQAEIARMTADTIRMAAMRPALTARLQAVLDWPANLVMGPPRVPDFPDSIPALGTLVSAAVANRPMLRAGARDLDAAVARTALARRDIWPDLTVGVQYAQRSAVASTERMGSLMIGAALPIFARSRQFRMREEATAMQDMALADLRAMRIETEAAVVEAHADLTRARTVARLYSSTLLPQTEAAAMSALGSYGAGKVDFMTVLDARMSVNRYRKEAVALEADEGKAWAELEMLLGRELFAARSATMGVDPGGR